MQNGLNHAFRRWRIHLAALVALILVLGVAALGGADAKSVALATRTQDPASNAGAASPAGAGVTPGALEAATATTQPGQTGPAAATSAATGGQTGAAATSAAAPGAARGAASQAGPKTVYDDGANDQEVRIGGSTFTSGPAATYGEQIAVGFAAGVNYVNEHGGINGRRINVKIYDDGADPSKQLANTKRLVEVDHVFALTMVYAPQTGQYVASKGIPVYHLGQFNEEFTNPWWFPLGGPELTSAAALAFYGARQMGV